MRKPKKSKNPKHPAQNHSKTIEKTKKKLKTKKNLKKKTILICPSIGDHTLIEKFFEKSKQCQNLNNTYIISPHPVYKKKVIKIVQLANTET